MKSGVSLRPLCAPRSLGDCGENDNAQSDLSKGIKPGAVGFRISLTWSECVMARQNDGGNIVCKGGKRRAARYWLVREEQRRLLDELEDLKGTFKVGEWTDQKNGKTKPVTVAASHTRHVLCAIDDHLRSRAGRPKSAGGWEVPISVKLLKQRTSIEPATVRRAIKALAELSFVDADGYTHPWKGRCYRVIVNWNTISQFVDKWADTADDSDGSAA